MFFVLLILGIALSATTAVVRGPRAAATTVFALTLALPCWVYMDVGAVRLDIRTMLALVGMACVLLHPRSQIQFRPILADFVVLALVGVQIAAEYLSTTATTFTVPIDIAVQWLVPYFLGRTAAASVEDVRRLLPAVVYVCLGLSLWSAVESITRTNPLGALVGHAGSMQAAWDLRWGLRRAEGPHTHPIFFGMHLVLLLPFALQAAKAAREGRGPDWWKWTPWCLAGGIFFTMSRGPQLGVAITLYVLAAMLYPHWRKVLLIPTALAAVFAFGSGDLVIDVLEKWSGEADRRKMIVMEGELVPYSGTTHRLLQVQVYAKALAASGWFGYGSEPLRAGETKIPFVEEHLRQMFSSIDNHYLQFGLQTGFLGLGSFLLLCCLGITYAAQAFRRGPAELHWLTAGLTGTLLALTLLMSSVWLASDYRFDLLAMLGFAGSLKLVAVRRSVAVEDAGAVSAPETLVALRLSPGHRIAPSH